MADFAQAFASVGTHQVDERNIPSEKVNDKVNIFMR